LCCNGYCFHLLVQIHPTQFISTLMFMLNITNNYPKYFNFYFNLHYFPSYNNLGLDLQSWHLRGLSPMLFLAMPIFPHPHCFIFRSTQSFIAPLGQNPSNITWNMFLSLFVTPLSRFTRGKEKPQFISVIFLISFLKCLYNDHFSHSHALATTSNS